MSIYDSLNPEQQKAVFQTEGPVLILAGAGSGKTRVLVHRIAYLMNEEQINPWNILAITFTNKAAGEMRERVDNIVGYGSENIWVATFHATCVRILRRYIDKIGYSSNFTIYDTDDQKSMIKDICKRLQIDTKMIKERALMSAISSAKDQLLSPVDYEISVMGDYGKKKYAEVYKEYQAELQKNNALDFDDILVKTVELFKSCPEVLEQYQKRFKYIMVDEYQDTNTAQFEFIRLLADQYKNLCVVGDDDQSIYKFRGANIRNILDFEKVYQDAVVIKLEQNYRSTQNVLDAANAVIRNNKGRKSKALWTDQEAGNKIHFRQFDTAYEEAQFIAEDVMKKAMTDSDVYGETAVLYRTNAQSRLLEEQFVRVGIPYNIVGGQNFYGRREIKDILAYLKTIDNAKDDLAVKRIINIPKRGIGQTTIGKLQDYAIQHDMTFYDALRNVSQIDGMGRNIDKINGFTNMIQTFRAKLSYYGIESLVKDILEQTQYLEELKVSDEEDAEDRINNIDEFISKVVSYEDEHDDPELSEFLEEVALVADIDNVDSENQRVLLMTLHSAKGLEFNNVYMAGMEDGLFPSDMSLTSEDSLEIEEERRLAYVGITRAKKDLTLTYAKQRMVRGETRYSAVSCFVKEIPEELLDQKPAKQRTYLDDYEPDHFTKTQIAANPFAIGKNNKPQNYYSMNPELKKVSFDSTGAGDRVKDSYGLGNTMPKAKVSMNSGMAGLTKGASMVITKPDYEVGDMVSHIKFGTGKVLQIEKGPRDYQVTVDFDEAGTKIMYAAFAKLQKI